MTWRERRRWRAAVLPMVVFGLWSTIGCYKGNVTGTGLTALLIVDNQSFSDVNVFAMRATVATGRRLGTVRANSRETLRVPESELQGGASLVVNVRTVGGRVSWISPAVQVGRGIITRLDVIQSANGDLSRSQFYAQVVPREAPADTVR